MSGRKTKLTKDLINEAEKLIRAGNYAETVCQYLGIHRSTWYKWLQDGENAKSGLKKEFFDSIKKAESHAEIRNVQVIQKAAQEGVWQAAFEYLSRKFPDRWGRKDKVNADITHSGKEGGAIQHEMKLDLSNLDDQELKLLESIVEKLSESE